MKTYKYNDAVLTHGTWKWHDYGTAYHVNIDNEYAQPIGKLIMSRDARALCQLKPALRALWAYVLEIARGEFFVEESSGEDSFSIDQGKSLSSMIPELQILLDSGVVTEVES
ncbi:MAG TPA: hypothetical protein VHC95_07050 [Opitutales bacterium]|nr:hypothetical protein [Opitutales bacterium]